MYHMNPNVQWNYTVGWNISFVKLKLNNYDFFLFKREFGVRFLCSYQNVIIQM